MKLPLEKMLLDSIPPKPYAEVMEEWRHAAAALRHAYQRIAKAEIALNQACEPKKKSGPSPDVLALASRPIGSSALMLKRMLDAAGSRLKLTKEKPTRKKRSAEKASPAAHAHPSALHASATNASHAHASHASASRSSASLAAASHASASHSPASHASNASPAARYVSASSVSASRSRTDIELSISYPQPNLRQRHPLPAHSSKKTANAHRPTFFGRSKLYHP